MPFLNLIKLYVLLLKLITKQVINEKKQQCWKGMHKKTIEIFFKFKHYIQEEKIQKLRILVGKCYSFLTRWYVTAYRPLNTADISIKNGKRSLKF